MFDIGWSEFLVIGVVALVVIGPRDLPVALRTAGRYVAKARAMAREFRDGLDDIARDAEIKDIENRIAGGMGVGKDDWIDADTARKPAAVAAPSDQDEADLDEADAADAAKAAAPARPRPLAAADLHDAAERAAAEEADRALGAQAPANKEPGA